MNKTLSLLPALSMTLLLGCGSAPTRIHVLQPQAGRASPTDYAGPPLRVAAVHFPAELERIELVTENEIGDLKINDTDHWGAPLSKLAQQTLSADLLSRLPPGKVAFPRLSPTGALAELRIDILRLPAGGSSEVAASWQLTVDPKTQLSGVVNLPAETRGGSAEEVAQQLSALLARLADEIVKALPSGMVAAH